MNRRTALELTLEALELASECGGEIDREIYLNAKQALEGMIQEVVAYDTAMCSAERAPDGEDYNRLLSIIQILC